MMSVLQIKIVQEVFDHIADHMLYVTDVPQAMFESDEVKVTLDYPIQYNQDDRFLASPSYKLAARFGDTYMDELTDTRNITVADVLHELRNGGLKRLPYLEAYEELQFASGNTKIAILDEIISLVIDFENVFAHQPTDTWAERFVQIAKLHFLRWDRPFIARKLLTDVPVEEPVVESRTASLINGIESQGYTPVVEEPTQPVPSSDPAQALLDRIRGRQQANAAPSTLTKRVMDKLIEPDTFFAYMGGYYTFVTEQANPTLAYGQLTKKEVVYSVDNPEGDVSFVFEVIDDRGYIEPVRVTSLERAIVCKGDQIHYTDFNKVVKTMLRRLDL
jgi:hypothetical protein